MSLHEPLGQDAQTLLNRARTLDEPNEVDRARIWRSFERAALLSASVSVAAYAGAAAHQAGSLGLRLGVKSMWIKVGFVTLAAAGLAGSGYWRMVAENPAANTAVPKPVAPITQAQLLAETRLLQTAQARLTEGRFELALAAIAQHADRFPAGILAPERDAAKVFALCESGQVQSAREAAAAFILAHSKSPLLAKVKHACSAESTKQQ